MNREEATQTIHDLVYSPHRCTIDIERITNKIYDDFESRTCENCKYATFTADRNGQKFGFCKQEDVMKIQPEFGLLFPLNIMEWFSCNKWEPNV